MKSKFLLSLAISAFSLTIYAQIVPVGFKNPKSQLFKGITGTQYTTQSVDPKDGKEKPVVVTINTSYQTIAAGLRATAKGLKDNANQDFIEAVEILPAVNTQADYNTYEAKLENLENEKSAKLKEAKFFEKKAKAFDYLYRTSGTWSWRPVRNAVDAEMYYNGTIKDSKARFLSNSLFSFSSDGGKASIFNEIYADYFGPIRMGFGALISNKQSQDKEEVENKEEKREDAMQRLLGGGGNGVINLSYPLFNVDNGEGFAIKFALAPKFAVDIPKIGTEKNDYAVNYNLGAEGTIFYSGALDVFTLFTNFRFAGIGGNNVFFNNLDKLDKDFFGFNQVSFGLGITSSFRLSYNYYFGSSYVNKNFPSAISFTIIPN